MREPNLSAGKPVPATGASRGTGSGSQLGSLRQCRMRTERMASVSLRMLHQVLDFLVNSRGRNSDADLELSLDFG